MISFAVVTILFFLVSIAADVSFRQQSENLADLLMEEVILDSYINLMSPITEDHSFFTNVLVPNIPESDIGFFLFTRENPIEPITLKTGDVMTLKNSNFSEAFPTKLLIHGWTDTGSSSWLQDIRRNYLMTGDYNVIIVDWSIASLKEYLVSARLTKQIGDHVSHFLEFLIMEGVTSVDKIHILGHSLGAHIAGFIGSKMLGTIARITGMDPARPDFEVPILREPKDRLDPIDAKFVDVIHTCAGTVGFVKPIGHVDFYPNGGSFRQPGCPVFSTQYCSHGRSHQFMAESIINTAGFPAVECSGWKEFKSNKCDKNKNRVVYMGEKLEMDARGVYFLETNAEPPYGRGEV